MICNICLEDHEGPCPEIESVKREAPCYGKVDGHEYANGECIYCGTSQPGSRKERTMKQFGEE